MITAELLRAIMPRAGARADEYAPLLEAARVQWVGDDWHHVAMWLAQIAHESGELRYVLELADGTAYEGRRDLGNTEPGDGPRFRGRGLLQVTGRYNYQRAGEAMGLPLLDRPALLEQPAHAAASAGWVWRSHGLGPLCDAPDPLTAVTRRLNGGLNGLEARRQYYVRALAAMKGVQQVAEVPAGPAPSPPLPREAPAEPQPHPSVGEEPMAPFITAAIPALLEAAPALIRVFGKTPTAERNAKAAEAVAEIAIKATGGANVQDAVERLRDPEARAAFQAQVQASWFDLVGSSEATVHAARNFAREWDEGRLIFGQLRFIELLSLLFLIVAAGGGYMVLAGEYPPELKGAVITLILIGGFTGVKEFWFGSSRGSQAKDERMSER